MEASSPEKAQRISSSSTPFWRGVFPTLWTGGIGFFTLAFWLEWIGDPTPFEAKLALTAFWIVLSVLIRFGTRDLREVWLTDQYLLVEEGRGGVRIPLEDVAEIKESRGRQLKTVRLILRRPSAIGKEIRFTPILRGQGPFTDHPVVKEIKERKKLLAGQSGDQAPRLS